MPQFSIDDAKRLIGPIFFILSVLFAAIGATPGGFANLNPNQEGGSSLGRAWTSGLSSAPATNAAPVTVHQGERIMMLYPGTRKLSMCTLGFIDHEKNIGYTSAHCVPGADERTYTPGGAEVTNANNTVIGRAYPSQRYIENGQHTADDIAIIKFSDNVALGENTYSGNTIAQVSPDIEADICRYGATSRTLTCTPTAEHYMGDNVIGFSGKTTTHGDSGSAIYIDGVGVVGLYAGTTTYNDQRVSVGPLLYGYDAKFI